MEGPALRGAGRLCRIRFTLDRIKASPEATGRALESNAVAKPRTGLFSPAGRAAFGALRGVPQRVRAGGWRERQGCGGNSGSAQGEASP
jgi:hypothetical protein